MPAKSQNVSVNRLVEKMATAMIAEFDAEPRFRLRVARGRGKQEHGLELLRKAAAKHRFVRSRSKAQKLVRNT